MNCVECRENLVAYVEGLLETGPARQCQLHLESCPACRAEHAAITRLQDQLVASGRAAAGVSVVGAVMRRVFQQQAKPERISIMSRLLKNRWGFGLSAAAGAAAVVLIFTLAAPEAQARATKVLARGAQAVAKLTSIHFRGQLRTLPADNFGYIDAQGSFYPIELWKQFGPELKWRVEKPGRVAVMDGHTTLLYVRTANMAMKLPQPSPSAFDTDWLQRIANLSDTISQELGNAVAKGWKLNCTEERGADGRAKSVVTVEPTAGVPENDYLKNKFFDAADTRRVYRFDAQTELLESVQIYLSSRSGEELIFELNQIDCNQRIDPSVFHLELPANVGWYQEELQRLPDNEKYAAMSAAQAARAYFDALARKDWVEAEKFRKSPVSERVKQIAGGLEVVSVGTAFTSEAYDPDGRFVPYEIKLNGQVIKHNLALKKDKNTGRWFVDGGGF